MPISVPENAERTSMPDTAPEQGAHVDPGTGERTNVTGPGAAGWLAEGRLAGGGLAGGRAR